MNDKHWDGTLEVDAKPRKAVDPPKPDPEEEEYMGPCVSRVVAKWYEALAIKRNGQRTRFFPYVSLLGGEGDNQQLDLEFDGWAVVIYGRCLEHLLMRIKEHKIDWVREAVGNSGKFDPADEGKPFITKIGVSKVEDAEEGA